MILTKQVHPVKEIIRKMGMEKSWLGVKVVLDPEEANAYMAVFVLDINNDMQSSIISGLTHFPFIITLEPLRKSNQDRRRCAIPFLF
jgi:hypothetical protein